MWHLNKYICCLKIMLEKIKVTITFLKLKMNYYFGAKVEKKISRYGSKVDRMYVITG